MTLAPAARGRNIKSAAGSKYELLKKDKKA